MYLVDVNLYITEKDFEGLREAERAEDAVELFVPTSSFPPSVPWIT